MQWQFRFEPSAWLGLARMVIYVAGVFGLFGVHEWSEEQQGAAVILVESVTTLIQRTVVTPNVKL